MPTDATLPIAEHARTRKMVGIIIGVGKLDSFLLLTRLSSPVCSCLLSPTPPRFTSWAAQHA